MIVVDILCASSCLQLLRYGRGNKIYYIMRAKGLFDRLMAQMLKYIGNEFIKFEYELAPIDKDSPFFGVRAELDLFFDKYIIDRIRQELSGHPHFSHYEKRRIEKFLELNDKKYMYRSIEILYLLKLREKELGRPKVVLLVSLNWQDELKLFYKESGYRLDFYKAHFLLALKERDKYTMDFFVKRSIRRNSSMLFVGIYILSTIAVEVFNVLLLGLMKHMGRGIPVDIGKYDIAAIVPGYERTKRFNDLCWMSEFSADGPKTLAILHGPFVESTERNYDSHARRWVSLNRLTKPPLIFSVYHWLWPHYPGLLIRNMYRLINGFRRTGVHPSHLLEISALWIQMSKAEELLRLTGAKVLWTNIDGQDVPSLAACIAINRLNGVSVGATWSMFGIQDFRGYRNTLDVWFVWGDTHIDLFRKEALKAMVVSGYFGDFCLADHIDKAVSLRSAWLSRAGIGKVVCFYDNAMGHDIQHFSNPAAEYFEKLLSWVIKQPQCLLVIKAKKKDIASRYPDALNGLLRLLEGQRRVVYEFEKADLAPGFAADLVVGFGMTTLPSLLGTYGKKIVLLDMNGLSLSSPIGADSITYFSDPSDISDLLDRKLRAGVSDAACSEITINAKPNRLDAFVDGRASQRISEYIFHLITALHDRADADTAIAKANEAYASRWGTDKVVTGNNFLDKETG